MSEDFTKALKEQIDEFPPMIKYPGLLMILEILYQELPNAKREYDAERERILQKLFDLFEMGSDDD